MDEEEKAITLTHDHIQQQYGSLLKSLNATKRIFWTGQEWDKFKLTEIAPYIRRWEVEKIEIWSENKPQILAYIRNINFPTLKQLNLRRTCIESIEDIRGLCFPVLSEFRIYDNHLIKIGPLAKVNWPSLSRFDFSGNYVKDGPRLSQLHARNLIYIYIEWMQDIEQCNDIRWLVKLNSRGLHKKSILTPQGTESKSRIEIKKLQLGILRAMPTTAEEEAY